MDKRERWRKSIEFPQYEVSSLGRVRHIGGKPRKFQVVRGYVYVGVWHNGKYRNVRVHRLIANAFVPNPQNKPYVNHIDGNKANNNANNLEWCTASENETHKQRVLGKKTTPPNKTKVVKCIETGKVYFSIKEASEELCINYRHIGEVANGKRKTAGGYHWGFVK